MLTATQARALVHTTPGLHDEFERIYALIRVAAPHCGYVDVQPRQARPVSEHFRALGYVVTPLHQGLRISWWGLM